MLYGNRTTGSVMFAEELADLKNAHHEQLDLVHVLSREPRDVELFSGRLDGDRLRRPAHRSSSRSAIWTMSGSAARSACSPRLARCWPSSASRPSGCTWSSSTSTSPRLELRHPDRVVAGATSEVTVVLDGRTTTSAMPQDQRLLDAAQEVRRRPALRVQGRGLRHLPREGLRRARSTWCATTRSSPEEVAAGFVLTCQTFPVSARSP